MKKICPHCKGKNIARLVWGLPHYKFLEEMDKEEKLKRIDFDKVEGII